VLLRDWQLDIGQPAPSVLQAVVSDTLTQQIGRTIDTEHDQRIVSFFVAPVAEAGYANLYGRDVTDRRRAEEALRASESKFKAVFENAPIGISLLDTERKLFEANFTLERITRITKDGLLAGAYRGRKYLRPDGTEMPPSEFASARAINENQPVHDVETGIVTEDGQVVWTQVSAAPLGRPAGRVVVITQDITERKRAEEALRESEERFRSLYENATIGLYRTTPGGQILMANPTLVRMLGYPSFEELARHNLEEKNFEPGYPRQFFLQRVESEGVIIGLESAWKRRDGLPIYVRESARAIRDAEGRTRYYDGTVEDITERKRAEERTKHLNAVLRAIRNVNQLIVREKDRDRLLQGACDSLIETRGYYNTWIALVDESGALVAAAEAGLGESFLPLVEQLKRGEPTYCTRGALAQVDVLTIASPVSTCTDCPLSSGYGDRGGMAVRLEHAGEVYGLLTVSAPAELVADKEERALFEEVARDIAIAVHSIELEEKRKRAEEALRESEHLSRMIADNIPALVSYIDQDRCYRFVNQRYAENFGKPVADMVGKMYRNVVGEAYYLATLSNVNAAFSGQCISYETTIDLPGIGTRWLMVSYMPDVDEQSNVKGIFVVGYDITERKQAEEEIRRFNKELEQRVVERTAQLQAANQQLENEIAERRRAEEAVRQSEERFRCLSEAAFEAIVIHEGGVLLSANDQYSEMFGYEPKELLGKQVLPLTVAPEAIESMRKEITTGGVGPYESIGLRKDGTKFPMEIRVREMEYGGRKVRVAAIMDITERKRAEESLQQRTAQLETANEELEAFAYSVSHDLRAPLRGIDGWSLALLEDCYDQLDEPARQYLDRVRSEAQRMGLLIDDLLQLSRVTRAEVQTSAVDLTALAQTVVARLRATQPERQVEVVIQPGLMVQGDARLLAIVLTNLLDNAWKFTGTRRLARIEFGQTEAEGHPAFFMRDNGVGFDMTYAQKLFGVFQRLHKASEFPGTGIGLATVQRIVHRHGGRVWAEAHVDQGATFYFTLEEAA
jgi:PAS domain S-box-containing protein